MDLFTSLALRSLGAANDVQPLRPALFAADLPKTLPDNLEEVATTREVDATPRASAMPQIPIKPAPPSPQATSQTPRQSEPQRIETAQHLTPAPHVMLQTPKQSEPQQIEMSKQGASAQTAPSVRQSGSEPPPLSYPDPRLQTSTPLSTPTPHMTRSTEVEVPIPPVQTVRETNHEIHTREILTSSPLIEPQQTIERETLRELVREVSAPEPKPLPPVTPVRTPHASLLIPTTSAPRPPALEAIAVPPPQQAPVIQVTIGRVEVSAVPPARATRPQPRIADTPQAISLNDYLRDPKARPQ